MRTAFPAILAVALLAAAPAGAEIIADPIIVIPNLREELQPPPSPYDGPTAFEGDYDTVLALLFADVVTAKGPKVIVTSDINGPEYALALHLDEAGATIVTEALYTSLADADPAAALRDNQAWLKANGAGLTAAERAARDAVFTGQRRAFADYYGARDVKRCEIALDPTLARRIDAVWAAMVQRTRYSPQPHWRGGDIVFGDFHFAAAADDGYFAGTIENPGARTRPGLLAAIAEALNGYCTSKDDKTLTQVAQLVTALERRLKH